MLNITSSTMHGQLNKLHSAWSRQQAPQSMVNTISSTVHGQHNKRYTMVSIRSSTVHGQHNKLHSTRSTQQAPQSMVNLTSSTEKKVLIRPSLKDLPYTLSAKVPRWQLLSKQKTHQLSPLNMCTKENY